MFNGVYPLVPFNIPFIIIEHTPSWPYGDIFISRHNQFGKWCQRSAEFSPRHMFQQYLKRNGSKLDHEAQLFASSIWVVDDISAKKTWVVQSTSYSTNVVPIESGR